MIGTEHGTTNLDADLGSFDADDMLVKAQLAARIAGVIKRRRLMQAAATELTGPHQLKLSGLLGGRFWGVSEAKMLHCLTYLGRDVPITIGPTRRRPGPGRPEIVSG